MGTQQAVDGRLQLIAFYMRDLIRDTPLKSGCQFKDKSWPTNLSPAEGARLFEDAVRGKQCVRLDHTAQYEAFRFSCIKDVSAALGVKPSFFTQYW